MRAAHSDASTRWSADRQPPPVGALRVVPSGPLTNKRCTLLDEGGPLPRLTALQQAGSPLFPKHTSSLSLIVLP